MNIIISIELLPMLLDQDLSAMTKVTRTTLHSFSLFMTSTLLSPDTRQRLCRMIQDSHINGISPSDDEMLGFHKKFIRCEQHRCLTLHDFMAVEYAKENGFVLLANKGFLSHYAEKRGVAVVSLNQLEELGEQQLRHDRWRKERLKQHFSTIRQTIAIEDEPKQQPIDDDVTL